MSTIRAAPPRQEPALIPTLASERLLLRLFRDADLDPYASFWETDAARFKGGPC